MVRYGFAFLMRTTLNIGHEVTFWIWTGDGCAVLQKKFELTRLPVVDYSDAHITVGYCNCTPAIDFVVVAFVSIDYLCTLVAYLLKDLGSEVSCWRVESDVDAMLWLNIICWQLIIFTDSTLSIIWCKLCISNVDYWCCGSSNILLVVDE